MAAAGRENAQNRRIQCSCPFRPREKLNMFIKGCLPFPIAVIDVDGAEECSFCLVLFFRHFHVLQSLRRPPHAQTHHKYDSKTNALTFERKMCPTSLLIYRDLIKSLTRPPLAS